MQTMLSIKIDKKMKEKAQEVAHTLGVSLNAVVNQTIKSFIADRQITFADHPMPNKKTLNLLAALSKDVRDGKNIVGPFSDAKGMSKSLKS